MAVSLPAPKGGTSCQDVECVHCFSFCQLPPGVSALNDTFCLSRQSSPRTGEEGV